MRVDVLDLVRIESRIAQDPECDLDYCANAAREMKIDAALKNNFGFGGTNGTLVFKRV